MLPVNVFPALVMVWVVPCPANVIDPAAVIVTSASSVTLPYTAKADEKDNVTGAVKADISSEPML